MHSTYTYTTIKDELKPQTINGLEGLWYTDKQMQMFIHNNQICIFAEQTSFRCSAYSTQTLNNYLKRIFRLGVNEYNEEFVDIRVKHKNRIYWKANDALLMELIKQWGRSM